jgi:hypothetical protein
MWNLNPNTTTLGLEWSTTMGPEDDRTGTRIEQHRDASGELELFLLIEEVEGGSADDEDTLPGFRQSFD